MGLMVTKKAFSPWHIAIANKRKERSKKDTFL